MRYPKTKKTIAAAAVGAAALVGGGAAVANAATGHSQDPAVAGTIKAPAETTAEGKDTTASEQARASQLSALAKVSPAQAMAAAAKVTGGNATSVQLGDENGFVVYEVAVKAPSGAVDVKVDAGSGAVLAQEKGEAGESGTEGPETADANEGPDTADANDGPDTPGGTDTTDGQPGNTGPTSPGAPSTAPSTVG